MAKRESPLHALSAYLPEGSFDAVSAYIIEHKVHLTITRARATVLAITGTGIWIEIIASA